MKTLATGPYVFALYCPECQGSVTIPAEFGPRLTVDANGGRLSLRMSTKSIEHTCTDEDQPQLDLGDPDGEPDPDA